MFLLKLQSTSQAWMLAGALPFRYLALGGPVVADKPVLVFTVPPGHGVRWACPRWQLSAKAVLV